MDYKYIEQLMERYWQCETTLQEETILRSFFSQAEVPVWLMKYKPLFDATSQKEQPLGDDFDKRILSLTEQKNTVKARTISMTTRLMPLFKAAAVVAIILTLGNAAQAPWEWGYEDPKAALEALKVDSLDMGEPVQAEIIADTTQVMQPTLPKN
jgi:hypothetical protein